MNRNEKSKKTSQTEIHKANADDAAGIAPAGPVKKERVRYSRRVRGSIIAGVAMLCVLAVVFIGGGGWVMAMFGGLYSDPGEYVDDIPLEEEETGGTGYIDEVVLQDNARSVADITMQKDTSYITNILLLGVDTSGKTDYVGRSDSMIILTINKKNKTLQLTSLMRDTYVSIAGRDKNNDGKDDWSKLAHAYIWGGFPMLSKTIEQNFRLRIDKHIAVNFRIFEKCVDALGGVTIEISQAEANWMNRYGSSGMRAGAQEMTGKDALVYSRIRKLDSDYNRTGRQRKVLEAIMNDAKKDPGKLLSVFSAVKNDIRTNMDADEILSYIASAGTLLSYDFINEGYFPYDDTFKGDTLASVGWVEYIHDPVTAVLRLHQSLYQ